MSDYCSLCYRVARALRERDDAQGDVVSLFLCKTEYPLAAPSKKYEAKLELRARLAWSEWRRAERELFTILSKIEASEQGDG